MIDVLQRGLLRLVEIVDDCAGRAKGLVVARHRRETETFQVVRAEVL